MGIIQLLICIGLKIVNGVNTESRQSFLENVDGVEGKDNEEDLASEGFESSPISYLSLPNEAYEFFLYLDTKIVILESEIQSTILLKNIEQLDISSYLINLCKNLNNLSNSNFKLIIDSLISELSEHSLILTPKSAPDILYSNITSIPESSPKNLFFIKENSEIYPILRSRFLETLKSLYKSSIIIKTSLLSSLLKTETYKPLSSLKLSLTSTLTISTSGTLFKDLLITSSLLAYSSLVRMFKEIKTLNDCEKMGIEGKCDSGLNGSLNFSSNIQKTADSVIELRKLYTDQEGRIIINAEDLNQEIAKYEEIIQGLLNEEVICFGQSWLDGHHLYSELQILYETFNLLTSNSLLLISNGEANIVNGKVTDSEALTSIEYSKITEVSLNFSESIPIVSTSNSSNEITNPSGSLLQESSQFQISTTDLNSSSPKLIQFFSQSFVLLSTFINDKSGTGKIWVLPLSSPSQIYLLLEGFTAPVKICFDPLHSFLYVVDKKKYNKEGKIFQYLVKMNKKKLVLSKDVYIKIYSGDPGDCKVDNYGNLYFTDLKRNSINVISFADLFSGFKNKFFTIYQYAKENRRMKSPESFVFSTSRLMFFVAGARNSVYYAAAEVENMNQYQVKVLVEREKEIDGIAYGDNKIFYTVDGEVFCFNLYKMNEERVTDEQFIDPQGICFSDNKLFVADHGQGAIYVVDLVNKNTQILASVQAVYGLYCLDSSARFYVYSFVFLMSI